MEISYQSRRKFLGTVIAALAGVYSLGRFLTPQLRRQEALLRVPKVELPLHGALVYQEARMALVRDGDSVYALSLVCTHLGCTVNVTPSELICPCHGSTFDRQGHVLKGPAGRELQRYRVEERGTFYEVVV